jgi:hypothetical protein
MVDMMSGRYSIVAAPGPGARSVVKVFRFWLMKPIPGVPSGVSAMHMHQDSQGPVTTATFMPFGNNYRGGISLAVGWLAGELGGAQSIVAGQLSGGGVRVFSSGNALQGQPRVYLKDPQDHDYGVGFSQVMSFNPFGAIPGVRVGTTATTSGADLLVSGIAGRTARVVKYRLMRPNAHAGFLMAKRVKVVRSAAGLSPEPLAGN